MNYDDMPLGVFEVDCDGSVCGSAAVIDHVHPPQDGHPAVARVVVRHGTRVRYEPAKCITRLVMSASEG